MPPNEEPKLPEQFEQEGVTWIEIGRAACLSRTKSAVIREQVVNGKIDSLDKSGRTYIPLSAANRLKREAATMALARRLNKKRKLPPARNYGLHSDEKQEVLPTSSGRAGRNWLGQKPRS